MFRKIMMTRLRALVVGTAFALLPVVVVGQSSGSGSGAQTEARAEALADAARKGDAAAVRGLLDEGVDVNTKFRYGTTALSFACDRGHLDVAKLLFIAAFAVAPGSPVRRTAREEIPSWSTPAISSGNDYHSGSEARHRGRAETIRAYTEATS
jgi:hypothetical protein